MSMISLHDTAEQALALMRAQGFHHAQVTASCGARDELNISHNEPSLLRSTETRKLELLGLVDHRKASTELTDFGADALRLRVASLYADARAAPQDDANAVSSGQHARIVQGPQEGDLEMLADAVGNLLAFRQRETPKMMIDEGAASHARVQTHTLTSDGTDLGCSIGWYELGAFGTAREGKQASSFNHAGGASHDLRARPVTNCFGLGEMLRATERQIHAGPISDKFAGDVILMPNAVADLLSWLHGQIGDTQLIAGSSVYREKVGRQIASPLITLRSRFDAPGVAAVSADAFVAPPVGVVRDGRLLCLTPSLYGSRKTGLPHVPVAATGWELAAGDTPRSQMVASVSRGALVGRLSMGRPASNGDFSGVIKNSFGIEEGVLTGALSEVMISGNVAQMLRDVVAVSRERIDSGALLLPWLRIANLNFS